MDKNNSLLIEPKPSGIEASKHAFLTWLYSTPALSSISLKLLNVLFFFIEKTPIVRHWIPLTNPKKNNITYLPVNKDIRRNTPKSLGQTLNVNQPVGETVNEVLPFQILHVFIEKAKVHFVMERCICRTAFKCDHFTNEIGCLFMGDTALKLPLGMGRRVTREEAHQHAKRGAQEGLVPLTGKVNVDNLGFLTPDTGKLLSVCFCCHCCCMMGYYKHSSAHLKKIFKPIEGLLVEVSDSCQGCGTCLTTCRFDAITIKKGRAIHLDHCVGCGRCQRTCPNQAVTISMDNPNFVKDVTRRVGAFVDIS